MPTNGISGRLQLQDCLHKSFRLEGFNAAILKIPTVGSRNGKLEHDFRIPGKVGQPLVEHRHCFMHVSIELLL